MNAVAHLLRARSAVSRMSATSDSEQATREVALWSIDGALGELGYTVPPPRAAAAAGTGSKRTPAKGVGAAHA